MAGWGEAEWASLPGAGPATDDPSRSASLVLESLERLTPDELERQFFTHFCEELAAEREVFLPSRPEFVAVARRVVLAVLQSLQLHQQLEAGELLAWLRIEVRDSSRALPCRIVAEPGNETGYGMLLIDTLSERWGADLLPRGKGVWFELRVRERTTL